jgi:rare lipoprotein A
MRTRTRRLRPLQVAAGATLILSPTAAAGLAASQADAQSTTSLKLSRSHLSAGGRIAVTGATSPSASGQEVELQFAPAGGSRWHNLRHTRVDSAGRFRFLVRLRRSGALRVSGTTVSAEAAPAAVAIPPSHPRPVSVSSLLRLHAGSFDLLSGQQLTVGGALLPGLRGQHVRLEAGAGSRWSLLSVVRTDSRGGFHFHVPVEQLGREDLRVAFAGDRFNADTAGAAGAVTVFRQAEASWYQDGGSTACGFHAFYGVASRTLPCGTQVTFRLGGRSVTATVDDRGPYVYSRDFDLNQNTAGALGFGGVGAVWATA